MSVKIFKQNQQLMSGGICLSPWKKRIACIYMWSFSFYSFVLFFSPVSDGDSNKVLIEALTGDLKLYNCE